MDTVLYSEGWDPRVDIKLDKRQMTFEVPMSLLPLVRQTLYMRYKSKLGFHAQPGYFVTWVDDRKDNTTLNIEMRESLDLIPEIPKDLYRTKITIFKDSKQLVKITVHATTGCVLVQGKSCTEWREKEFFTLVKFVKTLYATGSYIIPNQMLHVPAIMHTPVRTSTRLQQKAIDSPDRQSLSSPRSSASLEQIPNNVILEEKLQENVATDSSVITQLPLTPLVTTEQLLDIREGRNIETQTPCNDMPYSKEEIRALMDDCKVQIKNEFKASMGQKIKDLECIVEILQKDITMLKKDKRDMRSQINGLQAQIKKTDATMKLKDSNSSGVIISHPVSTADKNTLTLQLSSPPLSENSLTAEQLGNKDILNPNQLTSLDKHASKHHDKLTTTAVLEEPKKMHGPFTLSSPPSSPSSSSLSSDDQLPVTTTDEKNNNDWQIVKRRPLPNERHAQRRAEKDTSFGLQSNSPPSSPSSAALNKDFEKGKALIQPSPPSSTPSSHRPAARQPPTPANKLKQGKELPKMKHLSPGERLAQRRVKLDTTRILIGDSVFAPLKPELMFPNSVCENISVSGLAVHEVSHWLANIPSYPNVIQCVLHVGINTCGRTATSVPESEWNSLFKLARKVFPNAEISMSSIIPPKSGEPILKKSVSDSNINLKSSCEKLGCKFIDNNMIFKTQNGAPRKALYGDNIHPNALGTGRLACHVKNGGKPFISKFDRPTNIHDYRTPIERYQQHINYNRPNRSYHNTQASHPYRQPPPYLNAINRENVTQVIPSFVNPIKQVRFEHQMINNANYASSATSTRPYHQPTNVYHYVYPIDPINGTQV